jgi:hypothetical protein
MVCLHPCVRARQSLHVDYYHIARMTPTIATWLADIPREMLELLDAVCVRALCVHVCVPALCACAANGGDTLRLVPPLHLHRVSLATVMGLCVYVYVCADLHAPACAACMGRWPRRWC